MLVELAALILAAGGSSAPPAADGLCPTLAPLRPFSAEGAARERFVLADVANLRARPSADARLLAKLPYGTSVDLRAERGGWARIQVEEREGFTPSCLLGERRLDLGALASRAREAQAAGRPLSARGWAERYVGALRTSGLSGGIAPGKPLPDVEAVRASLEGSGAARLLDDTERWLAGAGRFFVGECADGDLTILVEHDPSRDLVEWGTVGLLDEGLRGTIGWLRLSPWWGVADDGQVDLVAPEAWLLDFPTQRRSQADSDFRMEVQYTRVGPCPGDAALHASAPLRAVKVTPVEAGPEVARALDLVGLLGELTDMEASRVDAPGGTWLVVKLRARTGVRWPEEVAMWQLLALGPGGALSPVARVGGWTAGSSGFSSATGEAARLAGLGIEGRGLVAIVPVTVEQDGGGAGTYDAVVVVPSTGRARTAYLPRRIQVEAYEEE